MKILFEGDSITDKNRNRINEKCLGFGYVSIIASYYNKKNKDVNFYNCAISGSTTKDLKKRWKRTTIAINPDILFILVGVNDTWRRYDRGVITTALEFYDNYTYLIESTLKNNSKTRIIIIKPFLLPINDYQETWLDDLNSKITVLEEISKKYNLEIISTNLSKNMTTDGVHLNFDGDKQLAKDILQVL